MMSQLIHGQKMSTITMINYSLDVFVDKTSSHYKFAGFQFLKRLETFLETSP